MKLTDQVFLVGSADFCISHDLDSNVYVVDCGEELVMIDAGGGCGVEALIRNMEHHDLDPHKLKKSYSHTAIRITPQALMSCKNASRQRFSSGKRTPISSRRVRKRIWGWIWPRQSDSIPRIIGSTIAGFRCA